MEPASKKRVTIKLTPGKQKQVERAVALLVEHYGAALAVWGELTSEQREAVLAHSPLLDRLWGMLERMHHGA